MARVELEGVSKIYVRGGVPAVEQLDLTIDDREFLVLVGPSGCGKTTTLRMIAGLEEPSGGVIRIGGRDVTRLAPKDRDVAMVFQNYALYPHMTVYKNMAFGLEIRSGGGWLSRLVRRVFAPSRAAELAARRREIPARIESTADLLGIKPLLRRMPRELSGGERQRVALGRAIVREPAAFLFDEPLSNLDARLRVEMRRELKQLHRRLSATMVYVTHDQVEALTLGDRVAVMHRGRLQQLGAPLEVYDRPRNRFVAEFIGTPAMNLVRGRLLPGEAGTTFRGGGLEVCHPEWKPWEGREVDLGFRPEAAVTHSTGGVNRARVELVESLGDSSVVHLEVEAADGEQARLTCKEAGRSVAKPGDLVSLEIPGKACHIFDCETGENLSCLNNSTI